MNYIKYIKKLTDEDFGMKIIPFENPRHRYGSRGIIINDKNEIAILYKELKNEYKLVGGGIEFDENPLTAFKREALEETGCKIEVDDYLGLIEEQKSQDNFIQTSHVYVAHVIKNTNHTNFTEKEKGEGSKLLWLKLDDAMGLIKNCEDKLIASKYDNEKSVYHTKFIVRRDYTILKYYKEYL